MSDVVGEVRVRITADASDVAPEVQRAGQQITRSFAGISQGITRSLGAAGRAVGQTLVASFQAASVAAAGIATGALVGGLQRFNTLEAATRSLTIAFNDATTAGRLFDDVTDAVRGTPFALDAAASAASRLALTGIDLQQIPDIISAIGDSSAVAVGGASEAFEFLSDAIASMASVGVAEIGTLNEVARQGIPIWELLAAGMGVSTDELRDLVESGAVPAEEAIAALVAGIESGFTNAAGQFINLSGAAQGLGDTLAGAADNAQSALNRVGEAFLSAVSPALRASLASTTELFDSLTGVIGELSPQIAAVADRFTGLLAGVDLAAVFDADNVSRFLDVLAPLAPLIASIGAGLGAAFAGSLPVIGQFLAGFNPVVVAIGALVLASEPLRDVFAGIASSLRPVTSELASGLLPVVRDLVPVLENAVAVVGVALADAFAAIAPSLPGIGESLVAVAESMGRILAAVAPLLPVLAGLAAVLATQIAAGAVVAADALADIIEFAARNESVLIGVAAAITAALVPAFIAWAASAGAAAVATIAAAAPFIAIGAAVAAVAAAVVFAYENVDIFRAAVDGAADVLGNVFAVALDAVQVAIGFVAEAISGLVSGVADAVPSVDDISSALGGLGDLLASGLQAAIDGFAAAWDLAATGLDLAATAGSAVFDALSPLFDALEGRWNAALDVFATAWDLAGQGLAAARDAAQPLFDALSPLFEELGSTWNDALETFGDAWGAVSDATSGVGEAVGGIREPLGELFGELEDSWNEILGAFRDLWGELATVWEEDVKPAGDDLFEAMEGAWNETTGTFRDVWEDIARTWREDLLPALQELRASLEPLLAQLQEMAPLLDLIRGLIVGPLVVGFFILISTIRTSAFVIQGLIGSLTFLWQFVLAPIAGFLTAAFAEAVSRTTTVLGGLSDGVVRVIDLHRQMLDTLGQVAGFVAGVFTAAFNLARIAVAQLRGGLRSLRDLVGGALRTGLDTINGIVRSVGRGFDLFREALGGIAGFLNGIRDAASNALGPIGDLLDRLSDLPGSGVLGEILDDGSVLALPQGGVYPLGTPRAARAQPALLAAFAQAAARPISRPAGGGGTAGQQRNNVRNVTHHHTWNITTPDPELAATKVRNRLLNDRLDLAVLP